MTCDGQTWVSSNETCSGPDEIDGDCQGNEIFWQTQDADTTYYCRGWLPGADLGQTATAVDDNGESRGNAHRRCSAVGWVFESNYCAGQDDESDNCRWEGSPRNGIYTCDPPPDGTDRGERPDSYGGNDGDVCRPDRPDPGECPAPDPGFSF